MLFIGEATMFSSVVPSTAGDDSLRELRAENQELKLKNPRTSVGAGAFDLAEVLNQPATAPGLMSRETRPTTTQARPDTRATLLGAACGVMEAVPAGIDG
jgi:hypothetical protein